MLSSGYAATQSASDSYTDLSSVQAIRHMGKENKSKALDEISKQFESMMVRMMLKSMRDANNVFAEGNYLSSHEGDTYQQMYDDQLAVTLSGGQGIGLAEIMAKQLKGRFDQAPKAGEQRSHAIQNNTVIPSQTTNLTPIPSIKGQMNNQETLPSKFDGSVETFVGHIHNLAVDAAQKLGVDPQVLIAQSALETGWGKKMTADTNGSSFNLFNIKADQRWSGDSVVVSTLEFRQGLPVKEQAAFRQYASLEDSFNDYVAFIQNSPRYQQALASNDGESYIRGLSDAGYATDPRYADKILNIVNSDEFQQAVQSSQL